VVGCRPQKRNRTLLVKRFVMGVGLPFRRAFKRRMISKFNTEDYRQTRIPTTFPYYRQPMAPEFLQVTVFMMLFCLPSNAQEQAG